MGSSILLGHGGNRPAEPDVGCFQEITTDVGARHEKTETTQIYAKTSLKRLLEVHGKMHPAEQEKPDES